jgi:uncharacterized OB-fold protein
MAVVPGMTELTRPYWDAAREGRLVVQECLECHQLRHPPLPACPDCDSSRDGSTLGWREMSGTGTVYSYTVVRHPTHFAFADTVPYVIALVELTEGPRLVTGITGCQPEEVRVGMPVRAVFREVAEGVTLSYFEPVTGPTE